MYMTCHALLNNVIVQCGIDADSSLISPLLNTDVNILTENTVEIKI